MELYDKIHENEELKTYILAGNRVLGELGFTEHGLAHAGTVSKMSREILEILNYSDHECELAAVAGYMHDIGNMINRCDHAQSGGILAFNILRSLDVNPKDIALIVGAIGHHDEKTAAPFISRISNISTTLPSILPLVCWRLRSNVSIMIVFIGIIRSRNANVCWLLWD